jgi:hypothetical protein
MDRADHTGDDEDSPPSEETASGAGSALRKALRDVAPYLDLGWRLAGTAAFPPLLGFGLDLWLHTTPWMLLGGSVLGLVGAVFQLKRLQEGLSS